MNRIFRTLWSSSRQCWQAVPEHTKAAGKGSSKTSSGSHSSGGVASVILGFMFTGSVGAQSPPSAKVLPTGGVVAQGVASISQTATANAAAMTVNQTSQRAVINWNTFDLGSAASVNFAQPNAQAVTLNRVSDANPSQIYGRISAPGQVFLSNPSGVYFSPSAQVDVGALTATTHSISDANFMAGKYRFERDGATGKVVNEGKLSAALGGYIALLAPEVQNAGVVVAQAGTVAMAAGELITLNLNGVGGLASLTTTPSTIASLVENKHAVLAPDGQIVLSAVALNKLHSGVVKNSGSLEANSLVNKGGKIVLEGDDITLDRNSKIEAKGPTGGGIVLVGGDWQGSGDLRQATKVTMEAGATIDASATDKGDGGKVVLWSDVHNADGMTRVSGSIKAEAGPNGGDGGKVETSGHQVDIAGALVNAGASQGQGGLWLLDPYDYTIGATEATTIRSSLNLGTSFTVDTTNASGSGLTGSAGTGVITVSRAIEKTAGSAATLTLNAADNIVINANISSTTGALGLNMTAGGGISGSGNLSLLGGTATFNQAGAGTYSGTISGTGTRLTKSGAGTLTLAGSHTYTGVTTVSAGTLKVNPASVGAGINQANKNINVSQGATLHLAFASSNTFNGVITGAGGLTTECTACGANTYILTMSGANTYTGPTLLKSGNLRPGVATVTDANGLALSGAFGVNSAVTIESAPRTSFTLKFDVQIGSLSGGGVLNNGSVDLYGNTLTIGGNNVDSTFNGIIIDNHSVSGYPSGVLKKVGTGTLTLTGTNTYDGLTSISAGTLRAANSSALGATSGGVTVASGATLEIGGTTAPGNVAIGAEALTIASGGTVHNVAGANTYAGALTFTAPSTPPGNYTITIDTGTSLNFTATGGSQVVPANSVLNLNLTSGNLTFGKALSGTTGSSTYVKVGSGTLTMPAPTGMTLKTGIFARLRDPTGNDYSTVYGDTPDYTFGFYDSATGGNLVNVLPANYTLGTLAWTGTQPVAGSATGNYSLTYASGLTVTSPDYVLMPGGGATTWTVAPKPVTISLARPDFTYNGTTTYASLAAGATITTNTPLVGGDAIDSVVRAATLVGGGAANGVAQGGSYIVTPSNAAMRVGNASNYIFSYSPVTGTVLKAPLTMTANDASKLLGQADPAFSARYVGFVNGETEAVLTSPTVTRTDAGAPNTSAQTYPGLLQPSATSDNYAITPVNGDFTIVPANTLLIKVANVNKTYGTAPTYTVTSAQYLKSGDPTPLKNVTVTSTGGGHFTFTDGLAPTPTTGSFDLVSSATANSDVSNYAITVANFTKTGNNFTATTPAVQAGNLAVVPLTATLAPALTVSKQYDGSTAATGLVAITNKVGTDDVSVSGIGEYTDNAHAGTTHTYTIAGLSLNGAKASNYLVDLANLPPLTGNNGVITPAPLTVTTSNVVKTYDGTLSVVGATTAPALTVTSGTLYANASNGGATDSLSGGTFAFTNANAGAGNKTVTVSNATVTDGNGGGNYVITYVNNTTSSINPATLTLSTSDVVKTYDGTLSVVGATTAPALMVTSGTLYANASNGGASDSVSGGTFAFSNTANAGIGNKTVTVSNATVEDGNSGGNYIVSYASNNTSTINTKPLTVTAPLVTKEYDGTTSATGAATVGALAGGDSVNVAASIAFTDKNVGAGNKTVQASGLTIKDAGNVDMTSNYAITYADNTASTITAKALSLSIPGATRVYDGTTNITPTGAVTLNGVVAADVGNVTLGVGSVTGYVDKHVGANKTVTYAGFALSGSDAANYTLPANPISNAEITAKPLTVTAPLVTKVYDGTTSATGAATVGALAGGDSVNVAASIAFTDKNVGAGNKTVQASGLTIKDAGNVDMTSNYAITYADNTTSTITAKALTVSGAAGVDKVYDGTNATSFAGTLSGVIAGDSVTLSPSGTFAQTSVGTGLAVTAAGTLGGASASNYTLTQPVGLTANINAIQPTLTGLTSQTKTVGAANFTLAVTSNSAGAVTYTSSNTAVATVNPTTGEVTVVGAGNATITAAQAANGNYALGNATYALTVSAAPPSAPPPSPPAPPPNPALTDADILALTPVQVAALTGNQLGSLTKVQMALFNSAQLAAMTASQIAILTQAQIAGLTVSQIQTLSVSQLAGLTPTQLGGFSDSQLSSLSLQQAASLTAAQLAGLTPAQLALLIKLAPPSVPVEPPPVIVPPVIVPSVVAPAVVSLPKPVLTLPSPVVVAEPVSTNTPEMPTVASPAASPAASLDLTEMTTRQVALIPVQQVRQLSPAQIESMSGIQVRTLSPQQLGVMSSGQVAAFRPTQLQVMTTTQVASFAPAQLVDLQPHQIASFTLTQLKAMTPAQAQSLTTTQLSALNVAQRAAVAVDTITISVPATTLATSTQSTGVLPITVLDGGSASRATTAGVAFAQGPDSITLRSVDTPPAVNSPRADLLAFNDKLTTFMVTSNVGELVEFQGSLIGNRLMIIAPTNSARQVARAEMKLVLAAAITTLGREQRVMLADLQGVVFDLR